jgi:Flp pilus assembly pilin Flp
LLAKSATHTGATLVETVIIVLIGIACIGALTFLGGGIGEIFCDVKSPFIKSGVYNRANQTWNAELQCCIPLSENLDYTRCIARNANREPGTYTCPENPCP